MNDAKRIELDEEDDEARHSRRERNKGRVSRK